MARSLTFSLSAGVFCLTNKARKSFSLLGLLVFSFDLPYNDVFFANSLKHNANSVMDRWVERVTNFALID